MEFETSKGSDIRLTGLIRYQFNVMITLIGGLYGVVRNDWINKPALIVTFWAETQHFYFTIECSVVVVNCINKSMNSITVAESTAQPHLGILLTSDIHPFIDNTIPRLDAFVGLHAEKHYIVETLINMLIRLIRSVMVSLSYSNDWSEFLAQRPIC